MIYSTREISLDAMRKPAGNKGKHTEGQCMETLGSARERGWVVGSQILTYNQDKDHWLGLEGEEGSRAEDKRTRT